MIWLIEYIEDRRYVRITYQDLFSIAEHFAAITELLSLDFWQPGTPILIDHRKLDFGGTNIDIIKQASEFHQMNNDRLGASRIALLMKSMADFGRGRQFELLTKGKISTLIEVFLEEEKALDWLLKNSIHK